VIKDIYYELVVKPSAHYDLLLDFLLEIYEHGLEELEGSFILRGEEPFEEVIWAINYFKDEISNKTGTLFEIEISETQKENRDWVENFKKSIQPISIPPFYIHPSWHEPKDGAENILLDPALAFGSGHHETTSSVIEILKDLVEENQTLLDVGTGSGILSIISAKMGATVDFCDIDPLSVESARDNFAKNSLKFRDSWEGSANGTDKSYSLVVANIIPDVIIAISNQLKKRVEDGGKLILSGILEGKDSLVLDYFGDYKVIKRIKKNEWITLLLEKRGIDL
jgi:ribosomal protein L11 methyltransferase